jgi:hypothetical protein
MTVVARVCAKRPLLCIGTHMLVAITLLACPNHAVSLRSHHSIFNDRAAPRWAPATPRAERAQSPVTPAVKNLIGRLPKAELHLHIEGMLVWAVMHASMLR